MTRSCLEPWVIEETGVGEPGRDTTPGVGRAITPDVGVGQGKYGVRKVQGWDVNLLRQTEWTKVRNIKVGPII